MDFIGTAIQFPGASYEFNHLHHESDGQSSHSDAKVGPIVASGFDSFIARFGSVWLLASMM